MEAEIQDAIDDELRVRKAAWAEQDAEAAGKATARLEELYDELREARARHANGDRKDIARRARIELEIEKLTEPA